MDDAEGHCYVMILEYPGESVCGLCLDSAVVCSRSTLRIYLTFL